MAPMDPWVPTSLACSQRILHNSFKTLIGKKFNLPLQEITVAFNRTTIITEQNVQKSAPHIVQKRGGGSLKHTRESKI